MATNYDQMAKAAKKAGTAKVMAPVWVEFKKVGKTVVGRLKDKMSLDLVNYDGSFVKYFMDTDNGPVSFKFGQATDKEMGAMMDVGKIYSVTFKGTEDTGKGNPRNVFEIFEIPEPLDEAF